MPFVLFIVGLLLIISAVKGTQNNLYALLKKDFTGTGSFIPWIVSIGVIGGLGYFDAIKPVTNAFLGLVILVLFLSNGGFFAKFTQQTGIGSNVGSSIGGNIAGLGTSNSLGQMPSIDLSSLGIMP